MDYTSLEIMHNNKRRLFWPKKEYLYDKSKCKHNFLEDSDSMPLEQACASMVLAEI